MLSHLGRNCPSQDWLVPRDSKQLTCEHTFPRQTNQPRVHPPPSPSSTGLPHSGPLSTCPLHPGQVPHNRGRALSLAGTIHTSQSSAAHPALSTPSTGTSVRSLVRPDPPSLCLQPPWSLPVQPCLASHAPSSRELLVTNALSEGSRLLTC